MGKISGFGGIEKVGFEIRLRWEILKAMARQRRLLWESCNLRSLYTSIG